MQMPEEVEPRSSPSIVELALRQNAQQGRLARVHVPQDGNSQVQELQEKHTQKRKNTNKK